jgi:hypothetical protein
LATAGLSSSTTADRQEAWRPKKTAARKDLGKADWESTLSCHENRAKISRFQYNLAWIRGSSCRNPHNRQTKPPSQPLFPPQPPFSPIRSGPKAASKPFRQKQFPSSKPGEEFAASKQMQAEK